MKNEGRRGISVWLLLLFLAGFLKLGMGTAAADTTSILKETQKSSQENHQIKIVWWIPEEFWRASFAGNDAMSPAQSEKFLKVLRPYTLLGVVRGTMGPMAALTYEDEKVTRAKISIVDQGGKTHKPLAVEDYNADLDNFLTMMKPLLSKMLGPMGKNFNFYVFDNKTANGKLAVDAKSPGTFKVVIGEDQYVWHLPLGSLLPEKTCPVCHEKFSGAYTYCPFDGTPLPKG